MHNPKPYLANVPGDYFVGDGCCASCEVPALAAPCLFAWDDSHCYVARQATSTDEHGQMFEAIYRADTDCIYSRGGDRAIQRIAWSRPAQGLSASASPPTCNAARISSGR